MVKQLAIDSSPVVFVMSPVLTVLVIMLLGIAERLHAIGPFGPLLRVFCQYLQIGISALWIASLLMNIFAVVVVEVRGHKDRYYNWGC